MPAPKERMTKVAAVSSSRFSRLSLATALVFACISQNAFALVLGDIEVNSVINEPLSASIPVLNADGLEQAELIVDLGSATDYQIAGVTWDFSHSELQFDVGYSANGDLMVNVSSSRAIREPYLNLLVQARWPAGRLLREYTILLDFPVFTGEQDSSPSVSSAPVARASTPESVAILPAPAAVPVVVQRPVAPRSAPAAAQASPVPRVVSGAAAAAITRAEPLGEGDYRIQNGDTLWSVGGRVAQDLGVSRQQAMLAIREANPEAFTQGNLNMLRSGSVVRVPTRNAALSRTATQAASEFAQAMSSSGQIADATPLQSRATDFRNDAGSDQSGDAQFRLTSAEQVNAAITGSGVDQVVEENQLLSDINSALEEELQAASIENRDLSERLQNLEEQISVMEALIEVENNEIRAVQQAVTSTTPVVNTITTAEVQEEGLVSKLLGLLPIVGLVVIGLLVGAYLVIRRRKSGDHVGDIAELDEEYDEDKPIYAEDSSEEEDLEPAEEDWSSDFDDLDAFFDDVAPAAAETGESPEEEENESEKTQIFDASMLAGVGTGESQDEQAPEADTEAADAGDDEQLLDFSLDEGDLTTEDSKPEANLDQGEDDKFSLDFDLGGDDSEPDETADEPEAADAEPEEDENMLTFDVSDTDLTEDTDEESEQQSEGQAEELADDSDSDEIDLSDFGLDNDSEVEADTDDLEDDLDALLDGLDEDSSSADDGSLDSLEDSIDLDLDLGADLDDLSALLDEEEPSADQEPSANEESSEDSADEKLTSDSEESVAGDSDDTDDLLGDFGDDDLDLSEVADGGDVAEECETKLELAAAYIEMGDNSGAKELLDEVVREGDDFFQTRAKEILDGMS